MLLIFKTLSANAIFEFSDQAIAKQLQADGLALMADGFMPPPLPIDVLLLHRKFAGIFLICARLSAAVDIIDLLQPYLSDANA
jgi:uncharacterized membrane protein